MNLSPTAFKYFQSYVLQMQLEIQAGKSRATAKREFYKFLEQQGRKDLGELLLTYDAVLGERREMADKQNVNVYGGNFGNVNFGEQIGTIYASAQTIAKSGSDGAAFAEALKSIANAISQNDDLKPEEKKEALEAIETVGSQAELSPEKRKPGIFKAAMTHLPTVLSGTASAVKIWEAFGPTLKAFFDI